MGQSLSQKDISGAEKEKQEPGLELVRNQELDAVVDAANDLAEKVEGDEKVTGDDVLKLDEALGKVKFYFYGEEMTIDEVREILDLKRNMEIWKQIEEGDLKRVAELTFIVSNITSKLIEKWEREYVHYLALEKLKILSDDVARQLFSSELSISLRNVRNMSDKAIEYLLDIKEIAFVDNLEALSERAFIQLAESELTFTGNSYTSEQKAKIRVSAEMQKRIEEYRAKNKK